MYLYVSDTISLLWSDAPSILTNKWFLTYLLTAIFICPSLFVKKLSSFSYLSIFANFFLIVSFVCLIFYFFHYQIANDISFATTKENCGLTAINNNVFDIFHTIQSFNLAIFFHPVLSVLVSDLENPTRSRLMKLTWISSITSLVFHFFGAFFCYLINPENEDNIFYEMVLYNEDGSKIIYPEVILGQIAVYIVSICSNIVYVFYICEGRRVSHSKKYPIKSYDLLQRFDGNFICLCNEFCWRRSDCNLRYNWKYYMRFVNLCFSVNFLLFPI